MSVSIFIKSWSKDLKWLKYCLRFLEQNWKEPKSQIVVMLDEDCRDKFEFAGDLDLRTIYTEPWPDGYNHAMFCKACADLYCAGEQILLVDSDCMLLEESDASPFRDKLPIIPWVSYEDHKRLYPHSPWQKVTERVMGLFSERHYMPEMPILYWASTMRNLRRYIVKIHGAEDFETVVYSAKPFSPENFAVHPHTFIDYDCLGLYAATFENHRYVFRHESQLGPNPFRQFHSWTEYNDETLGILEDVQRNHCLR